MKRVLVTGAGGQIGSELVPALRAALGDEAVMATDLRPLEGDLAAAGQSGVVDCLDATALAEAAAGHQADTVFHLAALLSATAERDPVRAWRINMDTLVNVLEVARDRRLAVFVPSSVAAFGPTTPADPAPQDTLQRPTSIYGVTKVAGELLCDYYWHRWGVDVRGLRYPGLISYSAPPGGGTTDYAVAIFHEAVRDGRYTCFLAADTRLDMMYMPDAVRAAIELMQADGSRLAHRNAFNVTAMSLTPARLAEEIRRHLPEFEIDYDVDPVRQGIAESWPRRMDDAAAREEWGWRPEYDLPRMTVDMIEHVAARHAAHQVAHQAAPAAAG